MQYYKSAWTLYPDGVSGKQEPTHRPKEAGADRVSKNGRPKSSIGNVAVRHTRLGTSRDFFATSGTRVETCKIPPLSSFHLPILHDLRPCVSSRPLSLATTTSGRMGGAIRRRVLGRTTPSYHPLRGLRN